MRNSFMRFWAAQNDLLQMYGLPEILHGQARRLWLNAPIRYRQACVGYANLYEAPLQEIENELLKWSLTADYKTIMLQLSVDSQPSL